MISRHKNTAKLGASGLDASGPVTSGRDEVYLAEDTEQGIVDPDLETEDRGETPSASPSGTWSSEGWGIVAALIIALIVLGAALAIILKVGRGPEAGDRADRPLSVAAASFEHLINPELDPRFTRPLA
jgi:hypothetical protein